MSRYPLRVWLTPVLLFVVAAPLWLHGFEPGLFLAINHAGAPMPDAFWTAFSLAGTGWGSLGLVAPLLLLAPRSLWACLCTVPFAAVCVRGGKALIESPRPAALIDNSQMRIVGEAMHNVSMPSGHTLTAFSIAAALYFSLPAERRGRFAWLWLLAAATGLSRMMLGAHWPGDVAVGASVGILCGLLGNVLAARTLDANNQLRPWSQWLAAALLAACGYFLIFDVVDFPESLPLQWGLAVSVLVTLLAFAIRSARSLKAT